MSGRELSMSTADPGRFVLTLDWSGETGSEACSVGLGVMDAARLRDALSLWLAGVDEALLRRAVEAWQAANPTHDDGDELDGDAA